MPYENSLLVISMNGPQLKAVLERAYRNYYYYKYVPGYGGYSYYTTCMIDTNFGNQITYDDQYPVMPDGDNVVALKINGVKVDFSNASKYYNVSTVNYLAAGSCNFNNGGVSLWPLNQIVQDTQYYVRDAVIDYMTYMGTVSPAIEGRIKFSPTSSIQVLDGTTTIDPTVPTTVNFGITSVGVPVIKTFTIKNNGTGPLTLTAPTLPTGFTLVSSYPATIFPDASATFQVKMKATVAGSFSGPLSFGTNDVTKNPFIFMIQGQVGQIVSGSLGTLGATVNYTGTTSGSAIVTGSDYSFVVANGWTGTITPAKRGFTFTPASITVSTGVAANLPGQNFTAVQNADTIGVFRTTSGFSYLRDTNTAGFADTSLHFGIPSDKPVFGDWNGDGSDTVGIYRNGVFHLRNSNTSGVAEVSIPFGLPGDQPLAGDWNNDGVAEVGVFRNGVFYLRDAAITGKTPNGSAPVVTTFTLGLPGDVAVVGDWNGDGFDTVGVYRPSLGKFFLKDTLMSGAADYAFIFGMTGDKPVTGDWNGDGRDTIGIFRGGKFYLRNTNSAGVADLNFAFGMPTDTPVTGDWNGLP
jgi:hypothetical protein